MPHYLSDLVLCRGVSSFCLFVSRGIFIVVPRCVVFLTSRRSRRTRLLFYPLGCHATPWTLPCTLATGLRTGSGRRLIPWRGRSHRRRAASAGAGDQSWPRGIVDVGSLWVSGGQSFVGFVLLSPLAPWSVLRRRVVVCQQCCKVRLVGVAPDFLWYVYLRFVCSELGIAGVSVQNSLRVRRGRVLSCHDDVRSGHETVFSCLSRAAETLSPVVGPQAAITRTGCYTKRSLKRNSSLLVVLLSTFPLFACAANCVSSFCSRRYWRPTRAELVGEQLQRKRWRSRDGGDGGRGRRRHRRCCGGW